MFKTRVIKHVIVTPQEVYASRVAQRCVIYLDSNVWIDLAEARNALAADTLALARLARQSETAIFPLSYPAVTEFMRQQVNLVNRRQGHIMDELSNYVAIRAEPYIRDLEILGVYDYMVDGCVRSRRKEAFTTTACYIGDGYLEYPITATEAEARDITRLLKKEFLTVGVGWFREHMDLDGFRKRYDEGDVEWVHEVTTRRAQALSALANADGSLSAKRLRVEEHVYVLQKYIFKRFHTLIGIAAEMFAARKFEERVPKGSPAVLARLIETMPSVWLGCEMYVQSRLARDPIKRQNKFDHDHAVLGVPYSDAFVTADSPLLDLLRRCGVAKRYSCRLVRGLSGLHDYLRNLLDSRTVGL